MNVSTLSFEPGVTRLFGHGDIGSTGLLNGWASPEEAHSWNDGMDAIMELRVPRTAHRYVFEIEGEPFVNEVCPSQEMTLYCNGFWAGFWKLDEPRSYTIFSIIEPEQLFIRNDTGFARLVWLLPKSTRPADVSANNDGRRLGFCFRSLTVRPFDDHSINGSAG